jgi:hypothetical protein
MIDEARQLCPATAVCVAIPTSTMSACAGYFSSCARQSSLPAMGYDFQRHYSKSSNIVWLNKSHFFIFIVDILGGQWRIPSH